VPSGSDPRAERAGNRGPFGSHVTDGACERQDQAVPDRKRAAQAGCRDPRPLHRGAPGRDAGSRMVHQRWTVRERRDPP